MQKDFKCNLWLSWDRRYGVRGEKMEILTKKINNEQENWYKDGEKAMVDLYLGRYAGLIDEMRAREGLTILDIGGGAGYFSRELLKKLLAEGSRVRTVNVYLVDTHPYDTWNDGDERIHFIEGDALNIDRIPGGGVVHTTMYFAICFSTTCWGIAISRAANLEKAS